MKEDREYIVRYLAQNTLEDDAIKILKELRKGKIPIKRIFGRTKCFTVITGKTEKNLPEMQWILEKAHVGGMFHVIIEGYEGAEEYEENEKI